LNIGTSLTVVVPTFLPATLTTTLRFAPFGRVTSRGRAPKGPTLGNFNCRCGGRSRITTTAAAVVAAGVTSAVAPTAFLLVLALLAAFLATRGRRKAFLGKELLLAAAENERGLAITARKGLVFEVLAHGQISLWFYLVGFVGKSHWACVIGHAFDCVCPLLGRKEVCINGFARIQFFRRSRMLV